MKRRFLVELDATKRTGLPDDAAGMVDPALEWVGAVLANGGLAAIVRDAAVSLTTRGGGLGELVDVRVCELEPTDESSCPPEPPAPPEPEYEPQPDLDVIDTGSRSAYL